MLQLLTLILLISFDAVVPDSTTEESGLVGAKEGLEVLLNEYASHPLLQSKVLEVEIGYRFIRRTLPDGNSFFRAYSYALLESLILHPEIRPPIKKRLADVKHLLAGTGVAPFIVNDYYHNFVEMVEGASGGMSQAELSSKFQGEDAADNLVAFLRVLTSAELRRKADFYLDLMGGEGGVGRVEEFCLSEVEPMDKEAGHLTLTALTSALDVVGVRVVDLEGETGATQDFPRGSHPTIHLLFRPTHYDIIYPN